VARNTRLASLQVGSDPSDGKVANRSWQDTGSWRLLAYPEKRPNLLLLGRNPGYPMAEDFGRIVERSERGAIIFTLSGAFDYRVEIHPPGSEPSSFTDSFGKVCPMLVAVPLPEAGWYLARYGS
jgi:hypothetical protein